MSDYSGWMPSQIKIELRRRGARASGQKADLVHNSSVRRDAGSIKCNSRCVDTYDRFVRPSAREPAKESHNADLFITLKGFWLG